MFAKQIEPRLSLGTAALAATASDGLLFAFVLTGFEDVEFRTSTTAAPFFHPLQVALSHSLASAIVVGALAGTLGWRTAGARGAALLLALGVSHWVFDLITSPSLPLAPFANVYAAWMLSRWIYASVTVEAAFWFGALALYVMESRSVTSARRYIFWAGVVSWTYVAYANVAGHPRAADDAPVEMLILLAMIVGWAYWMNHARAFKAD